MIAETYPVAGKGPGKGSKKGKEITRRGTTTRGGQSAGGVGRIVNYANKWRETYNPLRNLTIRRAVELLELGQRGDMAYLQWTYRFIERRHDTLNALLSRCEGPLQTFDWEVKTKEELPDAKSVAGLEKYKGTGPVGEASTANAANGAAENDAEETPEDLLQEMAKAQAATLKAAYDEIDNLNEAVLHLHLAEFRGYSHLQKHRGPNGEVYHLEPLEQWCICRDGVLGDWYWNPESLCVSNPESLLGEENRIGSADLPMEDFIIAESARPIDESGLTNLIRANLADKDWDGFLEIYGIPGGVVVMPPNVPQGKESEYESAAREVAQGGSGAVPNGSDYKANDGPRGVDPFTPRLKNLEERLIMVGTGGKLTMLAESGSGTLAGQAHTDTFNEIANGRAKKISELFQRNFDAEVLAREHPGEPVLVYFKFGLPDTDSEATQTFKQEMLKNLSSHEAISRVIANQTDLKETVRTAGLPVNEDYVDPYLSVQNADGSLETGQVVTDAEGDVVGGTVDKSTTPELPRQKDGGQKDLTGGNRGNGEEQIKNRGGAKPELPALEGNALEAYAQALADDLESFRQQVESISRIEDDQIFTQRVIALKEKLKAIEEDLTHLPSAARVLAETQVAALFTGLTEKQPGKNMGAKI